MKIIIFALLTLVVFNSDILGQNKKFDVHKPENYIGIELGPSLSQLIYYKKFIDDNTIFDLQIGYQCGIFFQYNISSFFSLRSSIDYEKKMIASHMVFFNIIDNKNETESWHTFFNYLTIPLFAKYKFRKHKFFVEGGPYINILLLGKSKYEYTNQLVIGNITKSYRNLVLGISAGIGADIPLTKKFDISFEAKDCFGLTHIAKNLNDPKNKKTNLNSVLFLYSVIYHIPDKKK